MSGLNVLLLPDQFSWAMDFVCDALIENLPQHNFTKKKLHRRITGRLAKKYDVVFVTYPPYLWDFDPSSSFFIGGVNSFVELGIRNPQTDHIDKTNRDSLSRFNKLYVPCKMLQQYLKKEGIESIYTPYGVDPRRFYPMNRKPGNKLIFGFAGNPNKHGSTKGFLDYILPAFDQVREVELRTALGGDESIPHDKMVDFYNSVDVLVCMSRTETGPMPVLEAMACGKPVISTNVGMVPEIVSHLSNGIIVDRSIESLVSWIKHMNENRDILAQLGESAIKTISNHWTWSGVIDLWGDLIEKR